MARWLELGDGVEATSQSVGARRYRPTEGLSAQKVDQNPEGDETQPDQPHLLRGRQRFDVAELAKDARLRLWREGIDLKARADERSWRVDDPCEQRPAGVPEAPPATLREQTV